MYSGCPRGLPHPERSHTPHCPQTPAHIASTSTHARHAPRIRPSHSLSSFPQLRPTHAPLPTALCMLSALHSPLSALYSPLFALYSPYAPARCLMRQVPPIPTKRQLPHTITNCTLAPLRLRRSLCRTRRSRSRSLPCCLPRAHSPSRATLHSLAHASTDTLHTSQEPTPHGHFRRAPPLGVGSKKEDSGEE